MMKRMDIYFKTLILGLLLVSSLHAKNVCCLLINKNNQAVQELKRDTVSKIFLGKKEFWEDGKRIEVGYLNDDSEGKKRFFNTIVGKSYRKFKRYWIKKVFAGYGTAPHAFASEAQALEYVSSNKDAIIFVSGPFPVGDANVRVVTVHK